ncbi:MAG: isocitrate lyase/phosphoenolpyruvate mutase family protein [Chloroflexi bacterium]|nr:isocitrate lyase/phosphoenolpyruvate mutase family protein [Chloroflexota bacterium]
MADDELTPSTDEPKDDQPDRDWQAEATKWKALARKHEKAASAFSFAAPRLAEIEASGKSEQERLAEGRQAAARSRGVDLFLSARVDVFIRREGDLDAQVAEGTRRARRYREAGADNIYPIALSDRGTIRAMVTASGIVNVTLRRGGPLSIERARAAGHAAQRTPRACSATR